MTNLLWYYRRDTKYQGMVRVKDWSWWKEEMPGEKEMQRGLQNLDAAGNSVNFVLTHCAPQEIVSVMYMKSQESDPETRYLNQIMHTVQYDRWFVGHYHQNLQIMSKFILLYEQIIRIV